MFEKLAQIEKSYEELTAQISSPEITSDMKVYARTMKQHRSLEEIVEKYREVRKMQEELAGARELADVADDEEMRELALAEASEIEEKLPAAEEELKVLLLPRDPNDEKNVILEIRAGTGGDEATLFAAEILRMYARYAERQGWKMDVLEAADTGVGGIKEAVAVIEGDKVFSRCDTNRVFIASSVSRRPRPRVAFILPPLRSPYCLRPKRSTFRSTRKTCG